MYTIWCYFYVQIVSIVLSIYIILAVNVYVRPYVRPSVTNVTSAHISKPGPLRGLNFGMQLDWTLGNAMPRPEASACAERGARGPNVISQFC